MLVDLNEEDIETIADSLAEVEIICRKDSRGHRQDYEEYKDMPWYKQIKSVRDKLGI